MEETKKTRHHHDRRKGKTIRTIISNVVLVIAIGVFLFSGFKLYQIYSEYRKGEKEYEVVEDDALEKKVIEVETVDENGEVVVEEKVVFEVDFDRLLARNPDTIGWIRFDNPSKISYPVVIAADNDKYLKTTFEGKTNSFGALFADANNAADFSDRNTFIYGHNMKNGSMFGQLRKYKAQDFCKENPYFYIYTPDGKESKYQIFSVCIVEDVAPTYQIRFTDDADYLEYIDHIRSISRYDVDIELTAESQIVSLSTCTNVTETQRLVVHGVKIEETILDAQAVSSDAADKAEE